MAIEAGPLFPRKLPSATFDEILCGKRRGQRFPQSQAGELIHIVNAQQSRMRVDNRV